MISETKTLITTAALIGACSLFAATSAIAADERVDSSRPTLSGDGGTKTFENNAVVDNYTQTANTTLAGTGTIVNGNNPNFSHLTIASNANIKITGTYTSSNGNIAPSQILLNSDATLTANHIRGNYPLILRLAAGAVVNVTTLEFAGGGPSHQDSGLAGGAGAHDVVGTINAGTLNVGNFANVSVNNGVLLNIGSGGIVGNGTGSIKFGWNSHIGTTDSWSSSLKINLSANPTQGHFVTFRPSAGKSITLTGVLEGQGKLVKTDLGSLILRGTNTYAGGTVISAGTLVAEHNNALGTGAITVENGGALQIATGVVLNAAKGVTLEAGSKLVIDMSAHAGVQDVVLDILTIGAGQEFKVGDTIVTSQNVNSVLEGFYELTGGRWDIAWEYTDGTLSFAGAAIPEPSTFGLLAGLGALALVASRRRRSRKAA